MLATQTSLRLLTMTSAGRGFNRVANDRTDVGSFDDPVCAYTDSNAHTKAPSDAATSLIGESTSDYG